MLAVVFASSMALANPIIQKKHRGLKKNGAMINCGYCHTKNNIAKQKGYPIGKVNVNPSCKGSGCHPLK